MYNQIMKECQPFTGLQLVTGYQGKLDSLQMTLYALHHGAYTRYTIGLMVKVQDEIKSLKNEAFNELKERLKC